METTLNLIVDFNHNIIITLYLCCFATFRSYFSAQGVIILKDCPFFSHHTPHQSQQQQQLFHWVMIFKMLFTSFLLNSIHIRCVCSTQYTNINSTVQYLIKIINYVRKHIIYVNQIYVIGFLSAY